MEVLAAACGSQEIMRQEPAFFEGHEPVLVYIAKRLKDALRLEAIFSAAGVDYGVEADEYRGGILFQGMRTGAFFYVLPDAAEATRRVMRDNGYRPFEGGTAPGF
jgi:hypothetical protein